VDEFSDVKIIHRCFALAPTPNSIVEMFGSQKAGKTEILRHWEAANKNDDEHRICAAEMEQKSYDYPHSMPGLLACKAAELQGGQLSHWDMFDAIQKTHLNETLNIAETEVLIKCADDIGLQLDKFKRDFKSEATNTAVLADIDRAKEVGIFAVPSILINDDDILSGAHKYDAVRSKIVTYLNNN